MKGYFPFIALIAFILCFTGCSGKEEPVSLRVAIPYSDHILDPETNYYIKWLENETQFQIEPVTINQTSGADYLNALFASDSDMDIVMFGESFEISEQELLSYVEAGELARREDGTFSYPNIGRKASGDCGQILWINAKWLNRLGLQMPENTEELKTVLTAFRDLDPNGNGHKDEIPLIGSNESYALNPVELILNSFCYNDPFHNRMYIDNNGQEKSAVLTEEFREGLAFCHLLYEKGLLDERTFSYSKEALSELLNSPLDLVGAFTTDSISDVLYQGNSEIMAKFMHVAPLAGPSGVKNALYVGRMPDIGAVVLSRSRHRSEAELLLETMMTKEASLIARYGEEGVDWDYSEGLDVSIYGTPSTIVTRNYIWNTPQNKHLNGIGVMVVPEKYLRGVTWNGVNSDAEYIDARAQMSYSAFLPGQTSADRYDSKLSAYMDTAVTAFVIGEKDITDDGEWKDYTERVRKKNLP